MFGFVSGMKKKGDLDHATIATRATQMVERLSEENRHLRLELEGYCRKVTKLQKVKPPPWDLRSYPSDSSPQNQYPKKICRAGIANAS